MGVKAILNQEGETQEQGEFLMERQIIRIDEEKCDGCGVCASGCPEGALQMIDGKARLVSEITCDGLGACIGQCPQGAIEIETREAAPYDECKTLDNILPMGANTLKAHLKHLYEHGQTTFLNQAIAYLQELKIFIPDYKEKPMECGCPGSAPRTLHREPVTAETRDGLTSQLGQWPVQMHLISPMNPVFNKSDLLLAADCCAFALADFNQKHLPGKTLAIACPKLDQNQEIYLDKMVALIDQAELNTITVMIMEVPCCGGLLRMAQTAVERAQRKVPIKAIIIGVDGETRKEAWV